jgi:hypothetical protein
MNPFSPHNKLFRIILHPENDQSGNFVEIYQDDSKVMLDLHMDNIEKDIDHN